MIHESCDERIEVVLTLYANAFKTVSSVERTLNSAELTLFDSLEQTILFNFCEKSIGLVEHGSERYRPS